MRAPPSCLWMALISDRFLHALPPSLSSPRLPSPVSIFCCLSDLCPLRKRNGKSPPKFSPNSLPPHTNAKLLVGRSYSHNSSGKLLLMDFTTATQQDARVEHKQDLPTMQLVTIKCKGDIADQLMEALMSFGASSVSIEDANAGVSLNQEIYANELLPWDAGRRRLWDQCHVIALFPPGEDVGECLTFASDSISITEMLPYEVIKVDDSNWIQEVKDIFQPVQVFDDLWIVPKWRTPPIDSAKNVILDPGLAFGTGEHPTTRLCLRWLKDVIKGGEHILDYGTGSGILAITALKLGARKAIGVDIDCMALSSAVYNATLNGFGSEAFEVFMAAGHGDDPIGFGVGAFDIAVANILLNPLLELSPLITGYVRPGGLVGVSGILTSQVNEVQEKYSHYLESIKVVEDDGWACVSGTRKY